MEATQGVLNKTDYDKQLESSYSVEIKPAGLRILHGGLECVERKKYHTPDMRFNIGAEFQYLAILPFLARSYLMGKNDLGIAFQKLFLCTEVEHITAAL